MSRYLTFTFTAALFSLLLELPAVAQTDGPMPAILGAPCDIQLRVEFIPDVPDPRDAGIVSSHLSKYPDDRLSLQRQDPDNSSVIALELTGPVRKKPVGDQFDAQGPAGHVRRRERDAANRILTASTAEPRRGVQGVSAVQLRGTLHAGPDGGWILEPLNGVSYVQQARDRYECDLCAVDQALLRPKEGRRRRPAWGVPWQTSGLLTR